MSDSAESLEQPEYSEIPPPPPSALYSSFEDLFSFLQTFHRKNGAALVKKSSSAKREVNGVMINTYVALVCDRGAARASAATGQRKSSTQKVNCPFSITATATKKSN